MADFTQLEFLQALKAGEKKGVSLHGIKGFIDRESSYFNEASNMAVDAQPALFTTSSSGVPAFILNVIDPENVRVLFTPLRIENILGNSEVKGKWTDLSIQFKLIEPTGEVTSYNDFSNSGRAGINFNYITRQNYLFQTFLKYGRLELERAAEGKIDYAAELQRTVFDLIMRAHNEIGFVGVSGLQNYGLINDPSLFAAITPQLTGTSSSPLWSLKDGFAIYNDMLYLFQTAQTQLGGNLDDDAKMVLACSPSDAVSLKKTTQYMGDDALGKIKAHFKNIRLETAPEYATASGGLVQLIVEQFDGIKTAYPAVSSKLMTHPMVVGTSYWEQKTSGAGWGSVIRRPAAIAQMLGVSS